MADKELAPSWAVMLHDALAHIFGWLSLEDMLMVIPRVCKAWNRVARDPVCWQILRLDQWSYGKSSEQIDRMVGMLVARSQGGLREISIRNLKNVETFKFIASRLHTLVQPQASAQMAEQPATSAGNRRCITWQHFIITFFRLLSFLIFILKWLSNFHIDISSLVFFFWIGLFQWTFTSSASDPFLWCGQ